MDGLELTPFSQDAVSVGKLFFVSIVANCPKKTWNLVSTTTFRVIEGGNIEIAIGGPEAPYMVDTNEKNRSSRGWYDRAIRQVAMYLGQLYQCEVLVRG